MIKVKKSIDGQFYFTICARNGQVLSTSETYLTKKSLRKGIAAIFKSITKAIEVKRTLALEKQIDKL